MYYRKEKRKSFGARLFDTLLLAALILAGLYFFQSRSKKETQAKQQAEKAAVLLENQATLNTVRSLLKESIAKHATIATQLDSVHNAPYWTWRGMDFYKPIIFNKELTYTLYPCSQTWQDSVINAKAQQALCFLLPQKQDAFVSFFQDAEQWRNQETRDNLAIARNKMHLWIDIEKRTLALLEK